MVAELVDFSNYFSRFLKLFSDTLGVFAPAILANAKSPERICIGFVYKRGKTFATKILANIRSEIRE